LEKEKVLEVLKQNKIDPVARPQDLSIQNWIDLTNSLES
jgi:16S rRNA A1518/A1519 N6-dimethyltransferase RsmA/KsgA/DIM1 with predicted DNA glycosylase/AP lyase activity